MRQEVQLDTYGHIQTAVPWVWTDGFVAGNQPVCYN